MSNPAHPRKPGVATFDVISPGAGTSKVASCSVYRGAVGVESAAYTTEQLQVFRPILYSADKRALKIIDDKLGKNVRSVWGIATGNDGDG